MPFHSNTLGFTIVFSVSIFVPHFSKWETWFPLLIICSLAGLLLRFVTKLLLVPCLPCSSLTVRLRGLPLSHLCMPFPPLLALTPMLPLGVRLSAFLSPFRAGLFCRRRGRFLSLEKPLSVGRFLLKWRGENGFLEAGDNVGNTFLGSSSTVSALDPESAIFPSDFGSFYGEIKFRSQSRC